MWCSLPRFIRPITAVSPSSLTILCHHGVSAAPEKLEYSTQLVTREYADLNLSNKDCQEVGHVRVRQHVNPLSFSKMVPVELPDWNAVYKDAKLPLMVDIGSGSGRFLLWLAKRNCGLKNYLGLEIRPKLAKRAEHWVHELGLNNIHFMHANAAVSFKQFISTYPGPLVLVSILCPDPHFKKKHHKRRVVQKPLVDSIVKGLVPGGQIFIQSDVQEVAVDMRKYFDAEFDKLVHINHVDPNILCDNDGWLLSNPMGIRTEREIHAELEGASIYRRMYQKQW
ncbi:tRNA (guanine-N(7)-)-methyltransferase-like [Salvia hispanica]|uniref:tRNA (guanine-N(7)-)-methyltransferase-like n=1 Tax=Salvia hispanica TaxID=49212 RepID=UPI002009092C|nr:tRNA (guanine-N(7)-)-methyltransferase-like [Salvia hispanica]